MKLKTKDPFREFISNEIRKALDTILTLEIVSITRDPLLKYRYDVHVRVIGEPDKNMEKT